MVATRYSGDKRQYLDCSISNDSGPFIMCDASRTLVFQRTREAAAKVRDL